MTDLERDLRWALSAQMIGDRRRLALGLIDRYGEELLAAVQAQVPREPTPEMMQAGYQAVGSTYYSPNHDRGWGQDAIDMWRAMYDAAPSAPAVADPIAAASSNEGAEAAAVGATRSTEAAPATGNEAGAVAAKRCADLVASASGHPHADLCARLHDVYEQSFPLRMDAAFAIEAADKEIAARDAEIARLTRELDGWRTLYRQVEAKALQLEDMHDDAEAKVERLRAAVKAVDAGYISFGDMPFAYRNARDKCKEDL